MKQRLVSLRSAVLVILLVGAVSPTLAQEPEDHPRAPRPTDTSSLSEPAQTSREALSGLAPQWGGHWANGTSSPFAFTRFDGGYSPKKNTIYFMGGRLPNSDTDGSVWSLNIAGAYTDMGVDLVTPVSNYTMNLLEDNNGMGFYIFGGRTSAGGMIDIVQVYYPDSNTVVQLEPGDNYPGSGTCTSGLNAVYNNKVYIAGGFDPLASPYNWGETWVFDPLAPAGSRWTQIPTANLNHPRGYIMSAVVDGKLYAIGGDWYDPSGVSCGATLCDEPIVEVLGLSDPAPTWNDAAAADLPEGCAEGRAYGFDSYSQYLDADRTHFAGRIVTTCGGWSNESERVYIYNTRTNHWNPFSSLNRIRRNQAAEFIPLASTWGVGSWGAGFMMMWGGRSGSDSNILTTPESYAVAAGGCPVLLVDDDWDYDSGVGENNGGRPFYETALSYLGYPYSVWDTVSQGVPSAVDMANYSITVWFTGYDWQTPITTTEEIELIAYLEGGGNLFMSSQDQEYAYPDSTIMSDYFQVDSVVEDVTIKDVVGNASDLLFADLGPYTLVRPDDWYAYWPTAGYEGPYDDAVSARPGAYEPLIYGSSDQANSTRYDGGHFKTVYLAFPLEWVNTIQERAQILGTALRWMCPIMESIYLPVVVHGY